MATSHTPYGRVRQDVVVGNKVMRNLVECPKEMKVVRSIFNLKEKGYTYKFIADKLQELNVPTKKGGKWHPITVQKIVKFHESINDNVSGLPKPTGIGN